MNGNARVKAFQSSWCLKYGIKVTARCPNSTEVLSAKCCFCETFGRDASEAEGNRKRRRTTNVQFFKKPWRTDNISKHMKEQHPLKFQDYEEATTEEKKGFFISTNYDFQPLNKGNVGLQMLINKPIVENIIGDLLLDSDSDDDFLNNVDIVMKLFALQEPELERNDGVDFDLERYLISIPNLLQFQLIVKYIRAGLSFRQCQVCLLQTKETTGLGEIGNVNMGKVIASCRYVCAMSFQIMSDVLHRVWAFSIAFDGGNKSNQSYLDVRIRFCLDAKIHNLHLVALPMHERHTGLYMFELLSSFLDSIHPNWKSKLIGIATDGASNMTGRHSGAVTRLHQVCLPNCYRVWCAAHQMDLVVQQVFLKLCDEQFVSIVMGITGHLRRQKNLILDMHSTCPRFIDSRWLSMQKLIEWLVAKRIRLQVYYDEKKPACTPPNSFWIIVYVLKAFLRRVNTCLVAIQGLTTLLHEQKVRMEKLVEQLIEDGAVEGPYDFVESDNAIVAGKYRMSFDNVEAFIKDQDFFVVTLLEDMKVNSVDQYNVVVKSVAILFAETVCGLAAVVAERNEANGPCDELPPVLPQSLMKLRPYDFMQLTIKQKSRLEVTINEEEQVRLNDEFKSLKDAYRDEAELKSMIDAFTFKTKFNEAWKMIRGRFPLLCDFVGGLASVFPGTSTVESDFSVIGWEKDEYRTSLTNFSLEGVLHCSQYDYLQQLRQSVLA